MERLDFYKHYLWKSRKWFNLDFYSWNKIRFEITFIVSGLLSLMTTPEWFRYTYALKSKSDQDQVRKKVKYLHTNEDMEVFLKEFNEFC